LVDFGVDETWAPARPTRTRRERRVDSWVDDGELFAPRYEDEFESARPAAAVMPTDDLRALGAVAAPVRAAEGARRRLPEAPGVPLVVETEAGPVSVDVLAHPAHVPAPVAAPEPAEPRPAAPAAPTSAAWEDRETAAAAGVGVPGRRTVTIRGRGAERDLAFPEPGRSRRPPVRRHERPGFRPDRTALWALVLGVVLVLVAATSSHAAALAAHARPATRSAARVVHVAAPAAPRLVAASRR
jgi:hypothetical protein